MRVFRFDEKVAMPLEMYTDPKGDRKPLVPTPEGVGIRPVARVRAIAHVACIHVGPGGRIGKHPATAPQLFLVVAGSGWVSGGGGVRVQVHAGRAVLWEEGEIHESGSDEGMTILVLEAGVLPYTPTTGRLEPLMPEESP